MGQLVDGQWHQEKLVKDTKDGQYHRQPSVLRDWVVDGQVNEPVSNFTQEHPDRLHLYVSMACPWAHRTLIARALNHLHQIDVSVVHPHMLEHGWEFKESFQDPLYDFDYFYQLYVKSHPDYTGRATVPILWDKENEKIINNESADILRLFNAMNPQTPDLYPQEHRSAIDDMNDKVFHGVNNGVYRCGFAKKQSAYDDAVLRLFQVLDELDDYLSSRDYLIAQTLTEADIRLFTTLIRFDAVYYTHFKCNVRKIEDYPHLFRWMIQMLDIESIRQTVDMDQIKQHYYYSHEGINPYRIVPAGPKLGWLSTMSESP